MKILAGFLGGLVGSVLVSALFLPATKIVQPILNAQLNLAEGHPAIIWIFMGAMLIGTGSAAVINAALVTQENRGKILRQIILTNFIIFLLAVPLYLVTANLELKNVYLLASIHLFFSIHISLLIAEKQKLLTGYITIFGTALSISVMIMLTQLIKNPGLVILSAPIVAWTCFGITQAILSGLYRTLSEKWKSEFL